MAGRLLVKMAGGALVSMTGGLLVSMDGGALVSNGLVLVRTLCVTVVALLRVENVAWGLDIIEGFSIIFGIVISGVLLLMTVMTFHLLVLIQLRILSPLLLPLFLFLFTPLILVLSNLIKGDINPDLLILLLLNIQKDIAFLKLKTILNHN